METRAQLDDGFLKKFPDVKEKLLGKIHSNIEEEFIALYKVQGEIKTLVDGLKIRLTSVEKAYLKHDPGEDKEFNPLNPGNESLLEYAGDSWGCFHILWVGVKTAIETVDYFEKESITNISDAFLKYKQVQTHLQDILDLTYYLRTS